MIPCSLDPNLPLDPEPPGCGASRLGYVLVPEPRGGLECRLLFPGDGVPRRVSIESKKRLEVLLKQRFLEPVDRRILMRLYMTTARERAGLQVVGEGGHHVILEMLECGRCHLAGEGRDPGAVEWLRWRDPAIPVRPGWILVAGEKQQPVLEAGEGCRVIGTSPLLVLDPAGPSIGPGECSLPLPAALAWLRGEAMEATGAGEWYRRWCRTFPEGTGPAPPGIETRDGEEVRPGCVLDLQAPPDWELSRVPGRSIVATLWFDYRGERVAVGDPGTVLRQVEDNGVTEIPRHAADEASAEAELQRRGLGTVDLSDGGRGHVPAGGSGGWHGFLLEHQADLEAAGWRIRFAGNRRLHAVPETAGFVELRPEGDGEDLGLEIGVEWNGVRLALLPWLHRRLRELRSQSPESIRRILGEEGAVIAAGPGESWMLAGGQIRDIVERVFELHDPDPFAGGERIRVGPMRAAEIIDVFGLEDGVDQLLPVAARGLAAVLRDGVKVADCGNVTGLRATLRDYQRFGVGWLAAMAERNLNGILADDMGLGKTLQTIAHLQREKEAGRLGGPALLVVPTSLMANWRNEAAKFAPGLTVLTLHGEGRATRFRAVAAADLVITTYALVQRDEVWHRDREYSWLILDEAQFIKNPTSKITKVLGRIRSGKRLCLTGTPVENHLGELWTLFDFLMPGYLGDRETFKRRFRQPIERENSAVMREILARRVKPFLLRRTKKEVVRELPPKTILLRPVEMTRRQREVYDHVRAAMQLKVRAEIAEKGLARSKFVILEALIRLRQVCCDPRLARTEAGGLKAVHSAKLVELMSLLPGLIQDDHRILIFSQFTSMLVLIGEELRAAGIGFVTLTGRTVDRERPVNDFQSGKAPVFLISLRAGGTGLNLTEADTVIHYDPWWNPQIENQATDRAHRIGQIRPVFVHKMIAAESVEEKILTMQERKAGLAAGILEGTGDGMTFAEADVEELLG